MSVTMYSKAVGAKMHPKLSHSHIHHLLFFIALCIIILKKKKYETRFYLVRLAP